MIICHDLIAVNVYMNQNIAARLINMYKYYVSVKIV